MSDLTFSLLPRDGEGFNRYRLVLVGVTDEMERRRLESLSATLDERLHLHLLNEDQLRNYQRAH